MAKAHPVGRRKAAAPAQDAAASPSAGPALESIELDPLNPNRGSKRGDEALARSVEDFGFVRGVALDRRFRPIAGNHVIQQAKQRGAKIRYVEAGPDELVAVVRKDLDLDTPKGRGAALADNRSRDLSYDAGRGYDPAVLAKVVGLGTPTAAMFTEAELRRLLPDVPQDEASTAAGGSRGLDPERVKALREKWKTAPGQLWIIRNGDREHRLVCGDCTKPEDFTAATKGQAIQLLLADPPYCSGGFQEAGRAAGTWGEIASDNLSTRGYLALMTRVLQAVRPQAFYLFTDWRMWIPLYDVAEAAGVAVRSMIVWDKGNPGLGGLWRPQHEIVMYASRQGSKRLKGEAAIGNVIQARRSGNEHHYTEKPVDLLVRLLENDRSSGRGDCPVFDGFLGSGSTMVAAERTGRACYGTEIEPNFVAVALERMAELGLKPKRA